MDRQRRGMAAQNTKLGSNESLVDHSSDALLCLDGMEGANEVTYPSALTIPSATLQAHMLTN